ncbi:MAG: hypothetical protein KZQ65_11315, partial [Candidatus Thiodiazotropha sp. (ex Gloverina cf. vestifex)]|nr:hypothetical protein [Candidatus Thiodiazotropha sp. (ex Gloverina cf. vestifex)]
TAFRMRSLYALHRSLTVTITAIQPHLRLSGTNRLGFQPSMAISDCGAGRAGQRIAQLLTV